MKQHTLYLTDEVTAVVQGLADAHTGGNFSAFVRKTIHNFLLPTDFEVHQRKHERMLRATEEDCPRKDSRME